VQLSKDLTGEFPEMTGFSERNMFYIQKWYNFYYIQKERDRGYLNQYASIGIVPQVVAELQNQNIQRLESISPSNNKVPQSCGRLFSNVMPNYCHIFRGDIIENNHKM